MNNVNQLERFEILGDLYYKRFGRLGPGKFEAPATDIDSSDELNRREFDNWSSPLRRVGPTDRRTRADASDGK